MEKYCISLDQAKKLVELGLNKDSEYYWSTFKNRSSTVPDKTLNQLVHDLEREDMEEKSYLEDLEFFPAYHVGELGEILGNRVSTQIEFDDGTWNAISQSYCGQLLGKFPTEAQARGQLLIYLLENSLL